MRDHLDWFGDVVSKFHIMIGYPLEVHLDYFSLISSTGCTYNYSYIIRNLVDLS